MCSSCAGGTTTPWPATRPRCRSPSRRRRDAAPAGRPAGPQEDWPAALGALERAVALEPDDPHLFASLFWARQQVCDWRGYDAGLGRLWSDAEERLAAGAATGVIPFQALTLPWPLPRLLAVARSHCDAWVTQNRKLGLSLEASHPARPGADRASASATSRPIIATIRSATCSRVSSVATTASGSRSSPTRWPRRRQHLSAPDRRRVRALRATSHRSRTPRSPAGSPRTASTSWST